MDQTGPASYGWSGHRVDHRVGAPWEDNAVSESERKRTGAEAPGENPRRKRRFSVRRKVEVVICLLRGEALETVSRELGVAAHELSRWRE